MQKLSGSIVGVGIDIVELEDLHRARFKKRVAEYFLTDHERAHMPTGAMLVPFLASRFAVKEAVIKAFPGKVSPFDFVIEKRGEQPTVSFVLAKYNKKYTVFVSLTHTNKSAGAVAILTKR